MRFFKRKPIKEYTGFGYQFRTLNYPPSLFMRKEIVNFIVKKNQK